MNLTRRNLCLTSMLTVAMALAAAPSWAAGYRTTVGTEPDAIPVIVVTGTPYEMGYAQGVLMKEDITALVSEYLMKAQFADAERFSNDSLDAAWKSVSPYVHERFVEELKGIAEGAGVPFETLLRAHMVPVVADYSCSGVAVWGEASKNGHLYQIRSLDYDTRSGLQDYPAVVVYIPEKGIPHVNVTFAGVIGVNTGMNAEGITLTEIGDTPESDWPFDLDGVHFMTLFRDILYDAHSLDEATGMIKDAKRIKKYHYVVGDGKIPSAVKMKAHAPDLVIWQDNDEDDPMAPDVFEGVVCHAESRTPIAKAHLKRYKGRYTPDAMIQLAKSIGSLDGNLLEVVYDGTGLELWVSYAEKSECAYLRPFVNVKLGDYVPYNPQAEGIEAKVEAK